MSWLPGKFVWFEHVSSDVAAARRFYESLFGWHTEEMDMGPAGKYPMIQNAAAGIGGYRSAPPGVPNHWMSYLSVTDLDASCRAAEAAGARVLLPPTDFPGVGRGATIADPQGAAFSLWKSSQGDPADAAQAPDGAWCWNELMTSDAVAALAFYEKVFGYGHDTVDMGPQGNYYILKSGETMRAGLMKAPMPGMPSFWMPYVKVADADASAARARELGATVQVPPTDIPDVGRFAVYSDPLGGAIAVLHPKM